MAETENTGETAGPRRPARFERILSDMRSARTAFQEGRMPESDYIARIIELDRGLTLRLSREFNQRSGFLISLPEEQMTAGYHENVGRRFNRNLPRTGVEKDFIKSLETRSNAPEGFYAPENEIQSRRAILNRMLENHPQLAGMTLADAADLVDKTSRGVETEWKYGEADSTIVISAALTMLDLNRDRIAALNPDLARALENASPTYLQDVVGERLMTRAETDEEFAAWEEQRRDRVVAAIRGDESLMADLGRLKPLLDSRNESEFLAQHRLRDNISQRIAGIYARVYDVPELGNGNVATVYAPAELLRDSEMYGYAGGVPGIRDEEYVVLRSSLYPELLLREPDDTARAAADRFLSTVNEEMRHAVDMLYTDRLASGQLAQDHPAFRHTNLILFNHFNYADGDEAYPKQYIERTAKEAAMEITTPIVDGAFPQPAAPQSQTPVIELPATTIRGGARP